MWPPPSTTSSKLYWVHCQIGSSYPPCLCALLPTLWAILKWAILQFGRFYILGDSGVGDFTSWAILEWAILEWADLKWAILHRHHNSTIVESWTFIFSLALFLIPKKIFWPNFRSRRSGCGMNHRKKLVRPYNILQDSSALFLYKT